MSANAIEEARQRFEALFGDGSPEHKNLPLSLRQTVYSRMRYAFHETDLRKFKRIKTYFFKTFHPDRPDSVFTSLERQAVFVTLAHIFDGEKLS